jgi:hypothetical protein
MMPLKLERNKKQKPQISLELRGSLLNSLKKRRHFKQNLKIIVWNDKKMMIVLFFIEIVLNTEQR